MSLPPIHMDQMAVKIPLGDRMLNVLYVKFGYFYHSVQEHSHSKTSYELHYIPQGQGTLVANGQRYSLTPKMLFMTGPGIAHEQITNPDDPMAEYCICFELTGGNAAPAKRTAKEHDFAHIAEMLIHTPFWIGQDTQNMQPLFHQLAHETSERLIGYVSMVTVIIEQIIIALIRNYSSNQPSHRPIQLKTLDDNRLVIIENCFLNEYATITLHALADKLGLSIRQTERTLKSRYGMTFSEKRLHARMSAAAYYLTTTALPVGAVADRTGFATLEYFCQSFKKHFKMTPGQYREHHTGGLNL